MRSKEYVIERVKRSNSIEDLPLNKSFWSLELEVNGLIKMEFGACVSRMQSSETSKTSFDIYLNHIDTKCRIVGVSLRKYFSKGPRQAFQMV